MGTLNRHAWRRLGCLESLRSAIVSQNTLDESALVKKCFTECDSSRGSRNQCKNWGESCPFGTESIKDNDGSLAELRDMILFLSIVYETKEPQKFSGDLIETLRNFEPLQNFYKIQNWFKSRGRESPIKKKRVVTGFEEIITELCNKFGDEPFKSKNDFSRSSSSTKTFSSRPLVTGPGKYIIFQGPPGTGKTREANSLAKKILSPQVFQNSSGEIDLSMENGTWDAEYRQKALTHMKKFLTITQFHQTYSYEDFIEGIRPLRAQNGSIRYDIVDGTFMSIWRRALGRFAILPAHVKSFEADDETALVEIDSFFISLYDFSPDESVIICYQGTYAENSKINSGGLISIPHFKNHFPSIKIGEEFKLEIQGESWGPDQEYVLIVDELNRGKVSRIFGELLSAMSADPIDNSSSVKTQYSKTEISLTPNLHILCTMNTCDKSVDQLDQALKRRFQFHELMPLTREDTTPSWKELREFFTSDLKIDIATVLDNINGLLTKMPSIDHDRQIGHSFFFKARTLTMDLQNNTQSSATPMLKC